MVIIVIYVTCLAFIVFRRDQSGSFAEPAAATTGTTTAGPRQRDTHIWNFMFFCSSVMTLGEPQTDHDRVKAEGPKFLLNDAAHVRGRYFRRIMFVNNSD